MEYNIVPSIASPTNGTSKNGIARVNMIKTLPDLRLRFRELESRRGPTSNQLENRVCIISCDPPSQLRWIVIKHLDYIDRLARFVPARVDIRARYQVEPLHHVGRVMYVFGDRDGVLLCRIHITRVRMAEIAGTQIRRPYRVALRDHKTLVIRAYRCGGECAYVEPHIRNRRKDDHS